MKMDGYSMTENIEEADAIFVNTCSVRDKRRTENLWAATVFPVFKTEKEVINCRCIGMYGRTSEGDLIHVHHADWW